jgi:hypothetical protein
MTIGFSPFLTADADETFGFPPQPPASVGGFAATDPLSARLQLIRRRVVTGYYSSPAIATELARRLVDREDLSEG